jgi:hypothetical protein
MYSEVSALIPARSFYDLKRRPLFNSFAVGLLVAVVHLTYNAITRVEHPGDFVWALRAAYTISHGIDTYAFTPDPAFVAYPLPVAFFGFPLLWIVGRAPFFLAGTIFLSISAGLLTWGMLRAGEERRLIAILLSSPFWIAVAVAQWSPLIVAAWYIPVLAPLLVLVKPQIALPVAFARKPSNLGLLVAAMALLLSLAIYPTWPFRFLQLVGPYQAIVPAFMLPFGPLLLLAALRFRDERARLFLFMSLVPQRTVYDFLPLWLVPKSGRDLAILSSLSWIVGIVGIVTWPEIVNHPEMQWAVQLLYIPVLAMVLWKPHRSPQNVATPSAVAPVKLAGTNS